MAEPNEQSRSLRLNFRVREDEYEYIMEKWKHTHCKSLSTYLRRQAIAGFVVKYDTDQFKKLQNDIAGIANNINQIAKRINATDNTYLDDISEIQEDVQKVWQSLISMKSMLQKLSQ